uniref:SCAN box domain-containing protein n=1 Tax=Molossus molossus TaxID=27622 RepID=A0A7J8FZS3_MOLMO|nr:hypothetical protein HJG59_008261 [Molossus molossus]
MPAELGQPLILLPPLAKAEDSPFSGPDAAAQGKPSSPETARQLFRQFRYQVMCGLQEPLRQLGKLFPVAAVRGSRQGADPGDPHVGAVPDHPARGGSVWVRKQCPGNREEAVTLVESLKGDPQRLWQWIIIHILGEDRTFYPRRQICKLPSGEVESHLEVMPQELGLQNSPSGPGEPLSHVVKEESELEQELWLLPSFLPNPRRGSPGLRSFTSPHRLHLHVSEKTRELPAEEIDKRMTENLNLEKYREQEPPDASCHASEEAPSQASLSGLFTEDEPRGFGEGETLPKAQENLQGREQGSSSLLKKGILENN